MGVGEVRGRVAVAVTVAVEAEAVALAAPNSHPLSFSLVPSFP